MIASIFELLNERKKINFHCEKRWRNLTDKQTGFFPLVFYRLTGERAAFLWWNRFDCMSILHKCAYISTTISDSDTLMCVLCVNSVGVHKKCIETMNRALPFFAIRSVSFISIYRPSFSLCSTHEYTWIKIITFACKYTGEYECKYFACRLLFFRVCVSLFAYSTVFQWFSFLFFLSLLLDIAIAICFSLSTEIFLGISYTFVDFVRHTHILWSEGAHNHRVVPLFTSKMFVAQKDSRDFFLLTESSFFFSLCLSAALLPLCFVQFTLSLKFITFGIFFSTLCTSFSILCIFACNFFPLK